MRALSTFAEPARLKGTPPVFHIGNGNEDAMMKRMISLILVSLFSLSLLSGCNTMRGAGEDIEAGGEAVQDASNGGGGGGGGGY